MSYIEMMGVTLELDKRVFQGLKMQKKLQKTYKVLVSIVFQLRSSIWYKIGTAEVDPIQRTEKVIKHEMKFNKHQKDVPLNRIEKDD